MQKLDAHKCFDGEQLQFRHQSATLNCEMQFSLFLPEQAGHTRVPVLYWLSGLTCSDRNFVDKAGAQRYAAEHGVAIVCPDTSPRGEQVPDDPQGDWDFGHGAGFYVNATQAPWAAHYRMYDYVLNELPALANDHFNIDGERSSIAGHSMGGHGALVLALQNPERYRSVSAFAPIASPLHCPWGEKALARYLGNDKSQWARYDSCELLQQASKRLPVLIDQGLADSFLAEQLKTELLVEASKQANYPMTIRYQPGYDHSYFFIASFIGDHFAFHAQHWQ